MSDKTVSASLLIRRPPGEVFAAFVNPMTLRKFWLNDASGPLAPGARVRWKFMVPGAEADVVVRRFEVLEQATGTIEGFSIVLCDLKTLLESGTSANLVRDKAALIIRDMEAGK
jgi:uncharacterized protein YndB with AHSA1/START domain